jgi:AAA15 family ATPase/GTPase
MLIRFRVSNHRSISEEQEFSFVAAGKTRSPGETVHLGKYGIDLVRSAGIYGANASGKSNLLKALRFMRMVVVNSQRNWEPESGIPREPFLLRPKVSSAPSSFEADIIVNDNRYTYGFILDSDRVREEWLFAYPEGKKQSWFVRDVSRAREYTFSRFLKGENKAIRSLTRTNSLFLSAAAQNNHKQLSPIFEWFSNGLRFVNETAREHGASFAGSKYKISEYQSEMLELIKGSDIGISSVEIEDRVLEDDVQEMVKIAMSGNPKGLKRLKSDPTLHLPVFRHVTDADSSGIALPFSSESHGTQVLFALAAFVVETLSKGGLLCVDELEASLHPLLSIEIVKMFNDPKRNPNNAQLLFNTHDTNILEGAHLRRDQIWFTEKDSNGATKLYPLSDYKPRKEENIKRGYLQGRYGGVPFIRIPSTLLGDEGNGTK